MNRKLAFIVFQILLFIGKTFSQNSADTIFTRNTDTIICHITLINNYNIFYDYGKNKYSFIAINKVSRYVLNNKDAEVIQEKPIADSISIHSPVDSLYKRGHQDAIKYYKNYNEAGTATLVIGLLSPIAGLIPAIACSSTPPKEKNLNFHNPELMKSDDYRKSYEGTSKRIKQHKVWNNWGIALGINVAFIIGYEISNGIPIH